MSSCFLLEPTTEDTKQKDEAIAYRLLENKLKDSIKSYINLHIKKENEVYSSYEFSEVYEHKPQEIKDYEALIKKRSRLPYLENKYHGELDNEILRTDSLISEKKTSIKQNKIHSTYELGHIFKLSNDSSHKVSEYIFFHYPNGKVKDLTVAYSLSLSSEKLKFYNTLHYQKSIFYNNLQADYDFYTKAYNQLEKETNQAEFINHLLVVVESIKKNGSFIPEKIIPQIVQKAYPNRLATKIMIRKSQQEGLAADKIVVSNYQIDVTFEDEQVTLNLDDWLRIVQ